MAKMGLYPKIKYTTYDETSKETLNRALVSSNKDAFQSYGKKKEAISALAAHKSSEALSYLINDARHNIRLGNDCICFWTDSPEPEPNDFLSTLLGVPVGEEGNSLVRPSEDVAMTEAVGHFLEEVRLGRPLPSVPDGTTYHLLGIAPYKARFAVRFYETGTLGRYQKTFRRFLEDTSMIGLRSPMTVGCCLSQCAPFGDIKKLPRPLITAMFDAVVRGRRYPNALYQQVLGRIHADKGFVPKSEKTAKPDDIMGSRAAVLKACLVRNNGRKELAMALNTENRHTGYLLGRMFAVCEKAQKDSSNTKVNASIRDRYMGAASTTPGRVFPVILGLYNHHISKVEYPARLERTMGQIMDLLEGEPFPATLDLEEQGVFYIGYYQQMQDLYKSKSDTLPVDAQ